jgi:hypothetical protein
MNDIIEYTAKTVDEIEKQNPRLARAYQGIWSKAIEILAAGSGRERMREFLLDQIDPENNADTSNAHKAATDVLNKFFEEIKR